MPIFVLIIGVVLVLTAWRDKQDRLRELLIGDFSGDNSYLVWAGALVLVYMFGKLEPSGRIGKWLAILVILVLLLRSGTGFFDMLVSQIKQIQSGIKVNP